MVFDTDSDYIEEKIRQRQQKTEIGMVTKVTARDTEDKVSNHEVNVFLRDEDHERRNVGISANYNGHIRVPEVGDMVVVDFLDGEGDKPYVSDILYTNKQRAPLGHAGDWRLRVADRLYLEMSPEEEVARIARKSGGDLDEPEATVEIDDSGENPTININTTGDVNINADGDIIIGDAGNAVELAVQNHTHEYDWSELGGSGTTSEPNESGTSTQVE